MNKAESYFRMISKSKMIGKSILAIFCLTIITSCDTDEIFNDLNTPKDEIVATELDKSSIGQVFAHAQYHGMMGRFGNGGYNFLHSSYGNVYSQYFSQTADFLTQNNYIFRDRTEDLNWIYFYQQGARSLNYVENQTESEALDKENALAKIYRVLIYQRMTDMWGPIPYSNFGNSEKSVAYDSQESIYIDFFTTLDEAVNVLQNSAGENAFGSNDLLYDGNISQWIKFANSLRLRVAMRVRYVDPALAKTEAEKAVSAGVIQDPVDNAMLTTTENNKHPLETITSWGEWRMATGMESALEGYDDPRLESYYNPAENGDSDGDGSPYEGLSNGIPRADRNSSLNPDYSEMDTKWLAISRGGTNPDLQVLRAEEVYFLRAEGALLGWSMNGSAEELYNMGIELSLSTRSDATEAEINAYISSSNTPAPVYDKQWNQDPMNDLPVDFMTNGSQEKKLEQIITQKWLGLYPDGWEAFSEWRRTKYPNFYPLIESNNPNIPADGMPSRLKFVTSEYNNNTKEVENAAALLDGPDEHTTKLWWDAKPKN